MSNVLLTTPSSPSTNNKAIVIPTDDLFVLAILNSRMMWWIINRVFQRMKDEGLSVDVQFLKCLPVPTVSERLRESIEDITREFIAAATAGVTKRDEILLLETELNELVEEAFSLTDEEKRVLVNSLPLRDPIASIPDRAE